MKLLYTAQMAWRSTPMGIDRSNLSCRSILILLVLFAAPMAAHSDTLSDSVEELAGKIVVALPVGENISITVRNISSLPPDEFASVEQLLKVELEDLKVRASTNGAITVNVRITLSENLKGLLWSAEIIRGDTSQAILVAVSRTSEFHIASYLVPIVLHANIIWEGPEQVLDAASAPDVGGLPRFVLLLPDGMEIQDIPGRTRSKVNFPPGPNTSRDARGSLELSGNFASAVFPSRVCNVNVETLQLMECHSLEAGDHGSDAGLAYEVPHDLAIQGKGTEMLMPQNGCDAILAAASSDYTKPDWVQAFSRVPLGLAISNKLDFPGPVLALRGSSGVSRAIVRNLKTGNYEAYSLSCGK